MKKCFLLIALLVLSLADTLMAQKLTPSPDNMFFSPDIVCINQPVTIKSNVFNASSYYWGFCSGYIANAPIGSNLGKNFGFNIPADIDIVKDSLNYYGFVVNEGTRTFYRLNFGTSLNNIPTVTNFGDLTNGLPIEPTTLYIVKDTFSRHWHIFVCGGLTQATSSLGRIDFGPHLDNPKPNVANFGNYKGVLNFPKGLFVTQDGDHNWRGYIVNQNTSELLTLDFSFNVSNTPIIYDIGNPNGVLNHPTDLAAVRDKGNWYLFVTNEGVITDASTSNVSRIDLGTKLDTFASDIIGNNLGHFLFRINYPSSITINRDCGNLFAYVTDSTTSQLIAIQMSSAVGPYYAVDYNNVGAMNFPSAISHIIRDHDDVYGFITNPGDTTLTRIDLQPCKHSTIPSFTEVTPPVYTYDTPGVYNIYFVVDQGLPTMRVDCKPINVLPYPDIFMNRDTTICMGDTIRLYSKSNTADSIKWMSDYNIDTSYLFLDSARVYPAYSYTYFVNLYYPFGCVVDTFIRVNISKVQADAGPDRWIKDGATTTLGGPNTSFSNGIYMPDSAYNYQWGPFNFMSDSSVSNPYVNPPYDYTYYLTVTERNDTFKCKASDTVIVHMSCGDFDLPNAFMPDGENPITKRFGILNKNVIKLNYFRVFNRWGEVVFETTNPTQQWDGNYKNKPAPADVYVYDADGFCVSGKVIKKTGNVTLMR